MGRRLRTESEGDVDLEIDLHLAKRLRTRRRLIGMTLQQVALATGVRFQQIQKYETGLNRMSASRLWQLAQVLDVDVNYFFAGLPTDERLPVALEARRA